MYIKRNSENTMYVKRDLCHSKETHVVEKRPTYIKRDSENTMYVKRNPQKRYTQTLSWILQTHTTQKRPINTQNRPIIVQKRPVYTQKRQWRETYPKSLLNLQGIHV